MSKTLFKIIFIFCSVFSLIQCSSINSKRDFPLQDASQVQIQVLNRIVLIPIDKAQIESDIKKFRSILQSKKKLSENDWKLHDSLLEAYIQLKYRSYKNIIKVPAKTKLVVPLRSYCLDPRKAGPANQELYYWKKITKNDFPYLKELNRLSSEKKYPQEVLQKLIWNLKNKTPWEEYPESEQKILREIDSDAASKLPSKMKSQIQSAVRKSFEAELPVAARQTLNLIEGRYHDYEDFEASIENLKSNQDLPNNQLSRVEGTSLYTENRSDGYETQEVSFYNPTKELQSFDLTEYYQIPYRNDVQPLAGYLNLNTDEQLLRVLEQLLFGDMIRLGLGFIPGLGDLIDLYEALTGKDFFSGKWLSTEDQMIAGLSIVAGSGQAARYAKKVVYGPESYVRETHKKYRQVRNTESYKGLEELSNIAHEKGIPNDWSVKVSHPKKGNQGLEFIHPENEHTKIRVMPGKPDAEFKNSRENYVRVQKDGKFYDKNGRPADSDSNDTHIPLEDFDFSIFYKEWK